MIGATWIRPDLPGEDHCRLTATASGYLLEGKARFVEAGLLVTIAYGVRYAADWTTLTAHADRNGRRRDIRREPDGWYLDGIHVPGLDDLVDIDFGFTPATNMAQVKRAGLAIGQSADLPAAWLDDDLNRLTELPQRYTRLSESAYAYVSPMAGYEATLVFAPSGFTSDYPGLWRMV